MDAVFVLADADVRLAARAAWFGATLNAGQTCMAVRRVFVHRACTRGSSRSCGRWSRRRAGAAGDAGQAEQAARLVKDAEARGGEVVRGGEPLGSSEMVHPTAVLSPTADLALCREASFAPLVAVIPFDDAAHAVALHNGCPFGLGAAVFTARRGRRPAARRASCAPGRWWSTT